MNFAIRGELIQNKVTTTVRDECYYRKHPGGVLDLMWIGFDVAMVEGSSVVHVYFVVIFEVVNEKRDITDLCAV